MQRSFDDQGGEDLVVNVSDKPASAEIPGTADRPVDGTVNGDYWGDANVDG